MSGYLCRLVIDLGKQGFAREIELPVPPAENLGFTLQINGHDWCFRVKRNGVSVLEDDEKPGKWRPTFVDLEVSKGHNAMLEAQGLDLRAELEADRLWEKC